MRIFLTVFGIVVLAFSACFASVLGILAFTPTMSCTGRDTGACAYGQLPMWLMLIGPWVIGVGASLATWVRTPNGPRPYWPWIGVVLIIGLFLTATGIASS
ncbi:hypothetical protein FKR81_11065 [Lentzea tibetensis]|uniref:Integral membrane protein n=1 Tax=Lentzea tibetensis TaxID=2591470 RepID=A0A563EWN8_9PSEU|nr:hypothetical protein [Lentzea tibetensis]TWP52115.1 hypothetical protein FKR81_11065 [Lentzea tibetensis]